MFSRSCSPDFERNEALRDSWAALKTQPDNFDAWIILLTQADQSNDIKLARDMYDRFLSKYPYCYGFWKKYADMERRHQHFSGALNVWERGILAIPLSVDLWLGFLSFMRELAPQSDRGIEKLRELYERALSLAGYEFHSDRLWQDYIAWEEAQGEWRRVAEIYDRLLRIPTAMYKSHMERFEAIVNMCNPYDLLSEEEFNDIFDIVRRKCNIGVDQIVIDESIVNTGAAGGTEIAEASNFLPVIRKKIHPDGLPHFQAEILSRRYRWHKETEAMVNARLPFEDQIKRPYFHVKPLEAEQLKNWRLYLDFEIIEGDENRITVLFERCLIACALYDQFWTKFARWTRKHRGSTEARNVYRRARQHIPGNVRLALAYSAFEESLGDYAAAGTILNSFRRKYPGYAAIELRLIGMFHLKFRNDRRLAEKIIRRALERDRDNVQLLLQLIDLAFTNPEFSQTAVIEAFDFAIKSNISDAEKLQFSQRKLDFLEDLSYDIDILQEHQDAHVALLAELENPPITTRKRRYNGREDSKYYSDRDRDLPLRRGSRYSEHRDVRDSYRENFRGMRESTGYYMSPNGVEKLSIKCHNVVEFSDEVRREILIALLAGPHGSSVTCKAVKRGTELMPF
ncbi:unnamed protein product [Angiostrongylus costaricensis]|uniref:Suf domain-containing protein n=1 Tax=Angiostrongylus costaricensis TaxID=334426 RepID=A0A158PM37_ANGCS|nr:unnamed protein product [Angiostrongylus costaricensis]